MESVTEGVGRKAEGRGGCFLAALLAMTRAVFVKWGLLPRCARRNDKDGIVERRLLQHFVLRNEDLQTVDDVFLVGDEQK